MKTLFYYETVLGRIGIGAEEDRITDLFFFGEKERQDPSFQIVETPAIQAAFLQLSEYLDGTRRTFSLLLKPAGTPFQQEVWTALQEIPYGKTMTYGELAKKINNPKAGRAVGMANNRNPISIFIPCHRVIGAGGRLVGYGGGLDKKRFLLSLERADDRVEEKDIT